MSNDEIKREKNQFYKKTLRKKIQMNLLPDI
jgi:hypothetical protein